MNLASLVLNAVLGGLLLYGGSGCIGPHVGRSTPIEFEWADEARAKLVAIERDLSTLQIQRAMLAAAGLKDDMSGDDILKWLVQADDMTRKTFFEASVNSGRFRAGLKYLWATTGHCCFLDIRSDRLVDRGRDILGRYREFIRRYAGETRQQVLRRGLREMVDALQTAYCALSWEVIQEVVWFSSIREVQIGDRHYIEGVEVGYKPCEINESPLKRQKLFEAMTRWLKDNETNLSWDPVVRRLDLDGRSCDPPVLCR